MAEHDAIRYQPGDGQVFVRGDPEYTREYNTLEFVKNILETMQIGVIISDAQGYLLYVNEKYGRLLSIDPREHIGKHVTEVIKTSRLHLVAKSGKPEINWPHELYGQTYLVQRIPLKQNGRIVAVLGTVLFNDPGEVSKLANQLVHLESKLKMYERKLTSLLSTQYTIDSIVGESAAMKGLKDEAMRAMNNDFPVLITGESGTGKELFAQAIHEGSARRFSPFVHFNCAAIPRDLFESELFGYEKGAFTGANPKGKLGKFELADQGTIFLDEIGELPLEMQPKLLRVLENKQFERVGGSHPLSSDFRVIAATNKNLQEMVDSGLFRTDLYYRINVIPLHIPPLRERSEDILPTARNILKKHEQNVSAFPIKIDDQAGECLCRYHWPGNVRELSNVLERIISAIQKEVIRYPDLPLYIRRGSRESSEQSMQLREHMQEEERTAIREALIASGNNKTQAARRLGIHRSLLYKKMRKYGLSV